MVHAPGFSHSDAPFKLLSIINLATVREVEKLIGKPIDPLRFRGNIYVDGLEPWEDHQWVGKNIRLGEATLKGFFKIPRCAATNVNLDTATRDMDIPKTLQRVYDHVDLGLYVEVSDGGTIRAGDTLDFKQQKFSSTLHPKHRHPPQRHLRHGDGDDAARDDAARRHHQLRHHLQRPQ